MVVMTQPVWITPAGNLGTLAEGVFYETAIEAVAAPGETVYFRVIAGQLPEGMQITANGMVNGTPRSVARIQGVPQDVAQDVTSRFAVRAYTVLPNTDRVSRLADRTFEITVVGQDVPEFVTPAGVLAAYFDGSPVDLAIEFTDADLSDQVRVSLVSGELPQGLTLAPDGRISGIIQPITDLPGTADPGYDRTAWDQFPFDFATRSASRNYQFTVAITDGKSANLRTFEIFVYSRDSMTADNTEQTADNSFITADVITARTPIILTPTGDLGTVRADNYFATRFEAVDFDGDVLEFDLTQGAGVGFDPTEFVGKSKSLSCETVAGNAVITVTKQSAVTPAAVTQLFVGMAVTGPGIAANTRVTSITDNLITVDRPCLRTGVATIIFSGKQPNDTAGNDTAGSFDRDDETFDSGTFSLPPGLNLDSGTGWLYGYIPDQGATVADYQFAVRVRKRDRPDIISDFYVYNLTITGNIDTEVIWLTDPDLGVIDNGAISLLSVAARNTGGRSLSYRMAPNTVNRLPQGLTLQPSGHITGRVSFNTFALDGGATSFDQLTDLQASPTTFDLGFAFTVNAFAAGTEEPGFAVNELRIISGGSGYVSQPTVTISAPPATAESLQATAGVVTIVNGRITSIVVGNPGRGYVDPPTVTVTGGGGSGAVVQAQLIEIEQQNAVSVFRRFQLQVRRRFNQPYETLQIQACPPDHDRDLLRELLDSTDIISDSVVYRGDDANFGVSRSVIYDHAYGLAAADLDLYVEAMQRNHSNRRITLGPVRTAQALDASGAVIYEVVYSEIVDDLVNNDNVSVSANVFLPYPVTVDSTQIDTVYPPSLSNMRDRVIDTVGRVDQALPLWMTSKQPSGRVLGFTRAWVIAYVKPGESGRVAYDISRQLSWRLNAIDFEVDRYVLDQSQTYAWDPANNSWQPAPPAATTFDQYTRPRYPLASLDTTGKIVANDSFAGTGAPMQVTVDTHGQAQLLIQINGVTQQPVLYSGISFRGDGSTATFVWPTWNPQADSTAVYVDAVLQTQGSGQDYVQNDDEFVFQPGSIPANLSHIDIIQTVGDYSISYRFQSATVTTLLPVDQGSTLTVYQISDGYVLDPESPTDSRTTFDGDATRFIQIADRWQPGDSFDKYLMFPKRDILGDSAELPAAPVAWTNNTGRAVTWLNSGGSSVQWVDRD